MFKNIFNNQKSQEEEKPTEKFIPEREPKNRNRAGQSRDQHKSPSSFQSYLDVVEENGSMYEHLKDEYLREKNFKSLESISRNLSILLYTRLSIWYSMGKPVTYEWLKMYREYFTYFKYFVQPNLSDGSYFLCSGIISIGIMLELENEEFDHLSKRVLDSEYRDFILDRMIQAKSRQHPEFPNVKFPYEQYVLKLARILRASTSEEAEIITKDTLENHFYTEQNLQSDYNSHHSPQFIGYWAWEIGAIVKMLGLDDRSFKDNPYYPYDLVHWND